MSHIFSGIYFVDQATDIDLNKVIDQAINENAQGLLVLIASQSEIAISSIPPMAKRSPVIIYSCVVPGIIYKYTHSFDSILVIGFNQKIEATIIKNLSVEQDKIEAALLEFTRMNGTLGSAFVLVDGMSNQLEPFITTLYEQLGSERKVIGGGAGYADLQYAPCIADASGCYSNAAIIFSISNQVKLRTIGKHGWHDIAGPFLVTEADGNTIHSLNYQPAFQVYKEAIKQFNGTEINAENFAQHAAFYPFGLKQLDSEHLVRDTIKLDGNNLICVGKVAQNSLVYILHAVNQQLINATSEVAKEISKELSHVPNNKEHFLIAIECISRALILQKDFSKGLEELNNNLPESLSPVGIISLGEIKNNKQGAIQFLNKALVLGGL